MKKTVTIFGLLIIFASAYTQPKITNTKSKLVGKTLVINYDIINAKPTDLFKIWVEITTKSGITINAKSLSGDVGDAVTGGFGKQIVWDIENDKIKVYESFYVKVYGKPNGNIANKITNKTTSENERPNLNNTNHGVVDLNYIGGGQAFTMSAVFPGWGLSRMDNGKPYWLMGVAAYGCLVGGYYLNMEAVTNYDTYVNSLEKSERDNLASKWEKQNKISKTLAYTAAGIWAVNLIWTTSMAQKAKQYYIGYGNQPGLNIAPVFTAQNKGAGVSLMYNF